MSSYVREKVLRVPLKNYNINIEELENNPKCSYGEVNKFQIAPTESKFFDFVIEHEYDVCNDDFGRTRALTNSEKEKYKLLFEEMIPNINMNDVRLVEYCWYNCTEAPDYYNETNDNFYDEI